MAKIRKLQTNFTSGVIDKTLGAREDIVYWYNALYDANNIVVMPQGGVKRRAGGQFIRELSPVFSDVSYTGSTVTAPNGGTAGNFSDNNEATVCTTTSNLSTTNPFVVAHIDFAEAKDITAVDIINYKLSAGSLDDEFRVQYSTDNAAWNNFGSAFNWSADKRSRRVRNEAGSVSARYWRVARIGATSVAATAEIANIKFYSDTATLSNGRLFPFAYSTEQAYMMVAGDKNIDVLSGIDYCGSVSIPHLSANLPVVNRAQSLDTMILYHGSHNPFKIFRQGASDEFDFRDYVFKNLPKYDYGAGVGGVDEVQVLTDGGTLASGNKFTILLEGERTTAITAAAARTDTVTAIQTALRALSNTSATGITVAQDANGFTVTFGGDDGKQAWDAMSVSVISGNSVWNTSRTTKGKNPGEDVFSATRGYPRCGAFCQSRHHMAGIPSLPDAWMCSVLGEFDNFDIDQDDATRAIMKRADTDQVGAIYQIIPGRHLTLLANDGEFYIPSEAIDIDSVLKNPTRCGSKEGIPAFDIDGALMFVQGIQDENSSREKATSLREFVYTDTEQSYNASILSKLSAQLIKNPQDAFLRKALSTEEADVYLMVNEDGTATAYTVMRKDDVNAFMPLSTRRDDKFLNVAVDKRQRVYWITERVVAGVKRRFVEMWNPDLYFDCGGIVDITAETFTAAIGQTDFTWTFANPATEDEIGVRVNGARYSEGFTIDMDTKTVTFAAEFNQGETVRIAKMINSVSGLEHLSGEIIQTFVDGSPYDDFTVVDGTILLDRYADTQIQYGFNFNVSGNLMPFRIPETETLADKSLNCSEVTVILYETIGIDLKVNNGNWYSIPLQTFDSNVLDKSAIELLFTGTKTVKGFPGYAVGAPVEFRCPTAGPFTLLGITREVRF